MRSGGCPYRRPPLRRIWSLQRRSEVQALFVKEGYAFFDKLKYRFPLGEAVFFAFL